MDGSVYFDDAYNLRLLDADKCSTSKRLQDNCDGFVRNVEQLQACVGRSMASIDQQVERIESERLKAIGLRNKTAALMQERADRQERLQELLRERQQHLSRLVAEEQSMLRVQQEQEALIAQLSDIRGGLQ